VKIGKEEVKYIAHLARLEFDDVEVEKFTTQLNDILLYMEKLNEVDTKDVPPMSHAIRLENAFREDVVQPSLPPEDSLANAPKRQDGFFLVPKVLE